MQKFWDIQEDEAVVDSLQKILDNDKTAISCHSGTTFPVSNLEVGMLCYRTDLFQLFQLKDLTPTWKLIADLSKTYTNKEYVDNSFIAKRQEFPKLIHCRDVASFTVSVEGLTGAIKITLPSGWASSMIRLRIVGYDYSKHSAWEAIIGGYNYRKGKWINHYTQLTPSTPFTSVRLGYDGTKCCILLGETTTIWQAPKIVVSEVMVGYDGFSVAWEKDWSIDLITDETGISDIVTPTMQTLATKESLDSSVALLASKNNPAFTGNFTVQNTPGDATTVYKNLKLDTSDLADYRRSVILLHRVYTDTKLTQFNFCSGSFHMVRGGWSANRSDILHVNTQSSNTQNRYNLWADLINQYTNENMPYLATCLYQAKSYVCLVLPYYPSYYEKGIFFEGRSVTESGYENLKVISYLTSAYATNPETILNEEIYNSLTKVEYTGDYLFNGTFYAPDGFGLGGNVALATGDWNNYTATGFYKGRGMANAPLSSTHWHYLMAMQYDSTGCYQIAMQGTTDEGRMFSRVKRNNAWADWKQIATTDQIPDSLPANGGNADTVCGKTASDLMSYTDGAIATLVNSAPEALDTLYELSNALGNDPNFSATVMNEIGKKATKGTTLEEYGITNAAPDGFGLGKAAKTVSGDWNNVLTTGFFVGENLENSPTSGKDHWYYVLVFRYSDNNTGQIAIGTALAAVKMWFRRQLNGNWSPWIQLATPDQIPTTLPANGGNADTLGGKKASDFALSNHTHTLPPKGLVFCLVNPEDNFITPQCPILTAKKITEIYVVANSAPSASTKFDLYINGTSNKTVDLSSTVLTISDLNISLAANSLVQIGINGEANDLTGVSVRLKLEEV